MHVERLVALLVAAACLVAGCATAERGLPPALDEAPARSSDSYFADVPVRVGFRLVEPSFVYEGTHRRIGQLRYRGPGEVLELVRYYREAMVTPGWELVTAMGQSGRMDMLFRKGTEVCQVHIINAGYETEIILQVGEDERAR